jgi:hypothetical protein
MTFENDTRLPRKHFEGMMFQKIYIFLGKQCLFWAACAAFFLMNFIAPSNATIYSVDPLFGTAKKLYVKLNVERSDIDIVGYARNKDNASNDLAHLLSGFLNNQNKNQLEVVSGHDAYKAAVQSDKIFKTYVFLEVKIEIIKTSGDQVTIAVLTKVQRHTPEPLSMDNDFPCDCQSDTWLDLQNTSAGDIDKAEKLTSFIFSKSIERFKKRLVDGTK